jgi:YfiH family protein
VFPKTLHHLYQAPGLAAFSWLEHGFGTRLSSGWLDARRLAHLKQVHSNKVITAREADGCLGEGDALLTSIPGLLLAVRTADCLPIILTDPKSKAVAVIHAGWRGLVSGILYNSVRKMEDNFSTLGKNLHAAIGPGIGPCCYQVGPEVATQFQPWFPERADLGSQTTLDLPETARRQLLQAGVPSTQIETAAVCTCCHAEEFFSYRREGGRAGRMWSAAGIRA